MDVLKFLKTYFKSYGKMNFEIQSCNCEVFASDLIPFKVRFE